MPPVLAKYLPYPSWDKIVHHYIPLSGAASYTFFSTHCLNPSSLASHFPEHWHPISLGIWFNAHVGIGLYYYHRRHLLRVAEGSRIMYTVFTTVMFNFGSILFWSAVSDLLPRNKTVRCAFGVLTSVCFLTIGREYLMYIDSLSQEID